MLGIEDLSERPDAIVCDDRRVYCVSQQTLRALSLDDGTSLWTCHLIGPENAVWSLALSERYVRGVSQPPRALAEDELESMPVVVAAAGHRRTGAAVRVPGDDRGCQA